MRLSKVGDTPVSRRASFLRLRDAALSGHRALLQTALADALGIWFDQAASILDGPVSQEFSVALKALSLRAEEAFLITALVSTESFRDASEIADFLKEYDGIDAKETAQALARWRSPEADNAEGVNRITPLRA